MTDNTEATKSIIKLNNVRLAFPCLFQPRQYNGRGTPSYRATLLIYNGSDQLDKLKQILQKVAKDKWGAKASAIYKSLKKGDKICLLDGDVKAEYDGFEGCQFVTARSAGAPLIIDRNCRPLTESDGRPYGGCYVNVSIEVWAMDNQYGKRINATLRGVQFVGDGDPFAGGQPADADEFDTLPEDDSGHPTAADNTDDMWED